jgi:hypothetical protein
VKRGTGRGWAVAVALAIGPALADAASFAAGVRVAMLPRFLAEVSGLAHSRSNPDVFWVHEDSGAAPQVHAVSRSGVWLGTYTLAGAKAIDWEDMAIGPAPDGRSYLYLADIGDNVARRPSVRVYRVEEPVVDTARAAVVATLTGVVAFDFKYDDGPRDAEGFMVDPLAGDFYVVSKREPDGNGLYRAVAPRPGRMNTLERVGRLDVTGTTAADISPDGLQVLVRRYSSALEASWLPETAGSYWRRPDASVSLVALLTKPGQIVPLAREAQGEAIAFAADNRGFYTTSEHGSLPGATTTQAPLTFYALVD